MQPFKLRWILALACSLLAGPVFAWQTTNSGVKRLYVEQFATKAGADKLREDVIAELRKLKVVSVVPDESNADLILGGGGEIWIRGYRSFSPRSHMKFPANGTPIYGGYLSVELRNRAGQTLWSYLATLTTGSGDIPQDLSMRITKHLAEGLNQAEASTAAGASPRPRVALSGAGATFPYPVYQKWFTNFRKDHPETQITYDAIGSEAGIRELLGGGVDFGASDNPVAIREIAPGEESNYLFFPSVVGAVVPIVNVPGVPEGIAFTPEALTGIFLGKVTKWNDPILRAANRGISLPDLDIVVVHRADGSGTSYAWTSFLSKTSPEWSAAVGSSLAPKWPTGRAATGNDGVAKLVKEVGGSIGYVEYIYALENHLAYGKVRNRNGEFVEASLESIAAAVNHLIDVPDDFKLSLVNAPGAGAYPIASLTWLVAPAHVADEAKRKAITTLLRWMLGPGQRQAAALGYVALPREIVAKEADAIDRIR
jgi:phosphate transport system substrate-binding protein